ncbi:MAG: transglutaminase domain-containing protein [Bacteroidales bacterium]|nr:transglutaminase domain-containing protein [Bacteroidales bacterium]
MRTIFLAIGLLFGSVVLAAENDSLIQLHYEWDCVGKKRECTLAMDSQLLDYYRKDREHQAYQYENTAYVGLASYCGFIYSEHDREALRELTRQLADSVSTELEMIRSAVTFVQALPYVTDETSMGEENYVRYPIETLADGVGDCEDKTVLLAAMLKEMGVDFVLLSMPDHLALGVHCDSVEASHPIMFSGRDYYYVETTTLHWAIGEIPKQFQSTRFEVVPCLDAPIFVIREVKFETQPCFIFEKASCQVQLNMNNVGPGRASGLQLNVKMFRSSRRGKKLVAEETFQVNDFQEGEERVETFEFKSWVNEVNVLTVTMTGDGIPEQQFELELSNAVRIQH